MQRLITFAVLTLIVLSGGQAEAQTRGDRCREPSTENRIGTLHTYRVTVREPGDLSLSLYFNNDNAGFVVLVGSEDGSIVPLVAIGAARFVNGRVSVVPETYEIAVTCAGAPADYRLTVNHGTLIRVPAPRATRGFDAQRLLAERNREDRLRPFVAAVEAAVRARQ